MALFTSMSIPPPPAKASMAFLSSALLLQSAWITTPDRYEFTHGVQVRDRVMQRNRNATQRTPRSRHRLLIF